MSLELSPITLKEAKEFVRLHHSHHKAPVGHKFSIAAASKAGIQACIIVGRPVARSLNDGFTLEVTRLCSVGHKNACSLLLAAAWKVTRNLGYRKLITYILASEEGSALYATNWRCVAEIKGRSWNCKSRPRIDKHPLENKLRFEIKL
ncbi:MAG TPA: hypothetical protein ENH49_06360 [Candidatus Marinimicrobia bacterium]|nr:hypothetical protein [Candidatus Neomarinimicrobiota bacterium]